MERKEEKWKGGKIREMEKRIEGIERGGKRGKGREVEGREERGGKYRRERKEEGSGGKRRKEREV